MTDLWLVIDPVACISETFTTEESAVAFAADCAQEHCQGGWSEEVENITVSRITHRPVRHVSHRRSDFTEEEWAERGWLEWDEIWEYPIEPVGREEREETA